MSVRTVTELLCVCAVLGSAGLLALPAAPGLTLADLNTAIQQIEQVMVTRLDEAENRICDQIYRLEKRVSQLEEHVKEIAKPSDSSNWWSYHK